MASNDKDLSFKPAPGTSLTDAAAEVKDILAWGRGPVWMTFNDTVVPVRQPKQTATSPSTADIVGMHKGLSGFEHTIDRAFQSAHGDSLRFGTDAKSPSFLEEATKDAKTTAEFIAGIQKGVKERRSQGQKRALNIAQALTGRF